MPPRPIPRKWSRPISRKPATRTSRTRSLKRFRRQGRRHHRSRSARQDGRADGGSRRPGEGGDVRQRHSGSGEVANQGAISDSLLAHSPCRSFASNDFVPRIPPNDLQQPPRRRAQKSAAARYRDDVVARLEIARRRWSRSSRIAVLRRHCSPTAARCRGRPRPGASARSGCRPASSRLHRARGSETAQTHATP